jgi:hypothetical protein
MIRRSAICTLLGFAGLSALQAADISGKWTAKVPSRQGETRDTTFTFKQEGNKLTGSMTGRQGDVTIEEGKVDGDNISFSVTQGPGKLLFKGTVSGGTIKFSRQREGQDPQEFTAQRAIS